MAKIKSQQNNWHKWVVIYPFWDDINSCNITDGWILTSYLDIQKRFLIFLNLTKLFPDQKNAHIWYPRQFLVYLL